MLCARCAALCCAARRGMRNGNVLSNAEYQRLRKVAGAGIRKATASVVTKAAPKVPPAEWRKRVHTARRNVFLMVSSRPSWLDASWAPCHAAAG